MMSPTRVPALAVLVVWVSVTIVLVERLQSASAAVIVGILLVIVNPRLWWIAMVIASFGGRWYDLSSQLHTARSQWLNSPLPVVGTVVNITWSDAGSTSFRLRTSLGDIDVRSTGHVPNLSPGDQISVSGKKKSRASFVTPGSRRDRTHTSGLSGMLLTNPSQVQIITQSQHLLRHLSDIKRHIQNRSSLALRGGELTSATTLGAKEELTEKQRRLFARTGTNHLFSVSGLHCGTVFLVVYIIVLGLACLLSNIGNRLPPCLVASPVALFTTVFYCLLCGARIATVRATLMIAIWVGLRLFGRESSSGSGLAMAGLAFLWIYPGTLFDASFIMSFGTVAFFIVMRRSRSFVGSLVMTSLWASLITAPIVSSFNGEVPWIGAITNLIAIPLVAFVSMPIGLLGLMCGNNSLGEALVRGANNINLLLESMLEAFAQVDPIHNVSPDYAWTVVGCALFVFVVVCKRNPMAQWLLPIIGLLALSIPIPTWIGRHHHNNNLTVWFVDVGHGDATVIQFPNDQTWLVDAPGLGHASKESLKGYPTRRAVIPTLRALGISQLDRLVITHPDPDHIGGTLELAAAGIEIDEIWYANRDLPPEIQILQRLGHTVSPPAKTQRIGNATMTTLWPNYTQKPLADPVLSSNDNSIVMKVHYHDFCLLLTGDIEHEAEHELLAHNLDCNVVKVPHHGSDTSSTSAFVRATSPMLAVISNGDGNVFNFPRKNITERWRNSGAIVLQTGKHGTIKVTVTPGGTIKTEWTATRR